MPTQPRYQPGDKIGGRYQVYQALMGGMGEVYLCLDLETIQPYALKTFQQRFLGDSRKLRAVFEQEVATWVALEKHPNIVRCFFMEILDNQPFMILEWIAGEEGKGADLRSWLQHGPLDLRTVLDFTIDVVRGLVHAQGKQPGLVHRDLKPENILVANGGLAKITDFGLAQIVESAGLEVEGEADGRQSMVGKGGIAGTPAYMAPEQWQGEPLDERTDIYAVGCILYELLTGEWPFRADFTPTTPQLFRRWLSAMQSAHEGRVVILPAEVPIAVKEVVQRCLAKRPRERPQTFAELLVQIEGVYISLVGAVPSPTPATSEFTAEDYNNRAVTYYSLKRYDQALVDCDRAIQLEPNQSVIYVTRGNINQALGKHDKALADYKKAIDLNPAYPIAYSNRGNIYDRLRQYEEALADYEQAIQLDPNLSLAYMNRGNTYTHLRRYEQALADFDRAIQLNPNDAKNYVNRGITFRKLQLFDKALIDFDQAVSLDPFLARAYSIRGATYTELQRYDEAFADHNRAIELDPDDAHPYCNRGVLFHHLKRYGEALTDYDRAIQRDPNYAEAYYNRGVTKAMLQRNSDALADYSRAIELNPNYASAYFNRGRIYQDSHRYHQALADFNRAIELEANNAQFYFNRGLTLANLERFEEAIVDFTQAITLDPSNAQVYFHRGSAYVSLNRYDEALKDYDCAIELDPNDPDAYYNRGNIYAETEFGFWQALADLTKTIELDPASSDAYVNIGVLFVKRGALEEGLPFLEKAAQMGDSLGMQFAELVRQELGDV